MEKLRAIRSAEFGYAESLLDENGLPTDDLDSEEVRLFVLTDDGDRLGIGGLQRHGKAALLRSVVVEREHRGEGYGTTISTSVLERAENSGVREVYLLTTDAADFFEGLGFDETDRDAVPEEIGNTPQFSELCPDSAVCMVKCLG